MYVHNGGLKTAFEKLKINFLVGGKSKRVHFSRQIGRQDVDVGSSTYLPPSIRRRLAATLFFVSLS